VYGFKQIHHQLLDITPGHAQMNKPPPQVIGLSRWRQRWTMTA